ncbi:multidrug effflux MFS transporter [Wenxinia saemankumensis]|uniref:Bcr/CflA family efflux transporter n=1 Tax=Wenxinia saemankumensis TaxID=1447782 RepID=A0A1M6EP82_9RHOB|nr:multidrug effflux MFS transporter [Wenxinia saemankumensis]SHI87291.1 MFS transporter, DHA1 family, bicyclomycin/chloramphenicol resistance protein [Wenxinia saemankumensis]
MLRTALVLGLMSAVGPFAIDLYLPALPAIEEALETDVAAVQLTLTTYFLAFGVSQLFYGPAADRFGRKPPIYLGLTIFGIGSVLAALAPTVGWLAAARFVQGLGGAAVMVIPRAIIRDRHTGAEATKLMAMVMLVISVSPLLAPLTGAGLLALGDWRLMFWALALGAVVCIAVAALFQEETLPPAHRRRIDLRSMGRGAKVLFTDPVFMGLTLIGGFGMASFFVFIASASFVYTESFGLTPTQFSLAFAVNAIGFFGASQIAGPLGGRFGMVPVMSRAVWGFAVFTVGLLVLTLMGQGTLWTIMFMLFCANFCLGLVIPASMVMALDPHGEIAGLASSLGGTMQMLAGGLMIVVTGPFFDGSPLPMVAAIAVCGTLALALALFTLPRAVTPPAAATP